MAMNYSPFLIPSLAHAIMGETVTAHKSFKELPWIFLLMI